MTTGNYGFRPEGLDGVIVPNPRDEEDGRLAEGAPLDFEGFDALPPYRIDPPDPPWTEPGDLPPALGRPDIRAER